MREKHFGCVQNRMRCLDVLESMLLLAMKVPLPAKKWFETPQTAKIRTYANSH